VRRRSGGHQRLAEERKDQRTPEAREGVREVGVARRGLLRVEWMARHLDG